RLAQRLARVDLDHRDIEDAAEGLQLFLSTDAVIVHAGHRNVLRAVLEDIARRQLRQRGGLADTGHAHQRDDAALLQRLNLADLDRLRQVRQQHPPGLARVVDGRDLFQQTARLLGRQPDTLQFAPEAGLLRATALLLAPGDRAQLHFD